MKRKAEYWTIWESADHFAFCTCHDTHAAAVAEADKCEAGGGSRHRIARVEWLPRKVKKGKA